MTSLRDRTLAVAALQLPLGSADESENIAAVAALVEQAAGQGAQVILPPELFSGPYFCKQENEALFDLARPVTEHPSVLAMRGLAALDSKSATCPALPPSRPNWFSADAVDSAASATPI